MRVFTSFFAFQMVGMSSSSDSSSSSSSSLSLDGESSSSFLMEIILCLWANICAAANRVSASFDRTGGFVVVSDSLVLSLFFFPDKLDEEEEEEEEGEGDGEGVLDDVDFFVPTVGLQELALVCGFNRVRDETLLLLLLLGEEWVMFFFRDS